MPEKDQKVSKTKNSYPQMLSASLIGINLVVSTIVGLVIGYYLDRFFNSGGVLIIVFLIVGIFAGFIQVFREVFKGSDVSKFKK
ncbi:MAG: hypothetical protein A2252_05175 [Elusimicrobia bacterium RIFOXYA2_FULL_39_19]|nr:MAG: hypothetical protein A2252_05175 [Elusimicrobia bacterium RIFOXYA2_FULL_39_19]